MCWLNGGWLFGGGRGTRDLWSEELLPDTGGQRGGYLVLQKCKKYLMQLSLVESHDGKVGGDENCVRGCCEWDLMWEDCQWSESLICPCSPVWLSGQSQVDRPAGVGAGQRMSGVLSDRSLIDRPVGV